MPGPVSDSYDPEFGTGANAAAVREALQEIRDELTAVLGPDLKNIVEVAHMPKRGKERQRRLIRFAIDRAMESL